MRSLKSYRAEDQLAEEDDRDLRSRSDARRERKMTEEALEDLSRKLVEMREKQLKKLELPEVLEHAVYEGKAIKSHTAHKRQLRKIRKELRAMDWDSLLQQIERVEFPERFGAVPKANADTPAGRWATRLTSEGDAALAELLAQGLTFDRQRLRQLVRAATRDGSAKAQSNLQQYVQKELLTQAAADASGVSTADAR